MCVFVFSISTPSGNICMSVRGCKVADRTALIHQLKHTYTHTHTLVVSLYNSRSHTHAAFRAHSEMIFTQFLLFTPCLRPLPPLLYLFHNTHTHTLLARLAGLKRGSVLDIPGIERPCFPCFPGNRPATNTPSEHHPVYRAECVCVQRYKANAEISTHTLHNLIVSCLV